MATLFITLREDGNLFQFPFVKDGYDDAQFVENETPTGNGTVILEVDLDDADDTTAAQALWLDTHDDVLSYEVR